MNERSRPVVPTFRKTRKVGQPATLPHPLNVFSSFVLILGEVCATARAKAGHPCVFGTDETKNVVHRPETRVGRGFSGNNTFCQTTRVLWSTSYREPSGLIFSAAQVLICSSERFVAEAIGSSRVSHSGVAFSI